MKLLTKEIYDKLIANGRKRVEAQEKDERFDPEPVLKLFHPVGAATWLLTELDPECDDIAFGLCDLGMGCPELGSVSINDLQTTKGRLGLGVERDRYFKAKAPLSVYTQHARAADRIIENFDVPTASSGAEELAPGA